MAENRVGILTFQRAKNYGALLQAYALRQAVMKLGFDVDVLDYQPGWAKEEDGFFHYIFRPAGVRVSKIRQTVAKMKDFFFRGSTLQRNRRMIAFLEETGILSEQKFYSATELTEKTGDYASFLTGSDQVWNIELTGEFPDGKRTEAPEVYFLRFVPDGKRRIAYAPSFGNHAVPERFYGELRETLRRFDAISVRDQIGKETVDALTGTAPKIVLDPTLLLTADDWKSVIAEPLVKEPYILCFFLNRSPELVNFVNELSRRTRYRILNLTSSSLFVGLRGGQSVRNAGPREFLSLIRGAEFIATTSFHGTAFALNFRRPFYSHCCGRFGNPRVESLLRLLKAEDRIFLPNAERNGDLTKVLSGDFSAMEEVFEEKRAESLAFLKNALTLQG